MSAIINIRQKRGGFRKIKNPSLQKTNDIGSAA